MIGAQEILIITIINIENSHVAKYFCELIIFFDD